MILSFVLVPQNGERPLPSTYEVWGDPVDVEGNLVLSDDKESHQIQLYYQTLFTDTDEQKQIAIELRLHGILYRQYTIGYKVLGTVNRALISVPQGLMDTVAEWIYEAWQNSVQTSKYYGCEHPTDPWYAAIAAGKSLLDFRYAKLVDAWELRQDLEIAKVEEHHTNRLDRRTEGGPFDALLEELDDDSDEDDEDGEVSYE